MATSKEKLTGLVLEIQRMSTEDGPGLRTTVFLKGCPLTCKWCHNPESISPKPQLQWTESRCIACKICIETCPHQALTFDEKAGVTIDRNNCKACGLCVEECPTTALELWGRSYSVKELADELVKDKAYFEKSGGGVTISGGEVTMQAEFSKALLKELKGRGVSTAIDTCGQTRFENLEKLLPFCDMVLFDMKEMDPERHKNFMGVGNEKILENLQRLVGLLKDKRQSTKLWIRTPIIPGATDTPENIKAIGRFIADNLGNYPERWELCSFNNLCKDKYARLDINWEYKSSELLTSREMELLFEAAKSSGVRAGMANWSGATKRDGASVPVSEVNVKSQIKVVKC